MNKKIAFDNRLCYERDVLRQHAIHQSKLQTILPTCQSPSKVYMDSNEPSRHAHLTLNRKRLQMEKERQTEIYMQNQRLAAKMDQIVNRQENVVLAAGTPESPGSPKSLAAPGLLSPRGLGPTERERSPKKTTTKPVHSPAYVHMPGIRLDSSQTPMVDCYLSPEFSMGRGNACKKTTLINKGIQKQRQQKIEDENRRLKERLKAQKPYYNTKKWDADWQHTATKFQHLHQNGTIGYLLPKTAEGGGTGGGVGGGGGGAQATARSPLMARRVKVRDGLPSLKPTTSHGGSSGQVRPPPQSRGGRLRVRQSQSQGSKTVDVLAIDHDEDYDDDDDTETRIIECEPFVLLEATTRKGVELTVEELQIDMHDPASGAVQPGDRGLLVRGRWNGSVEGDCLIALETLEKVAQEIDDLEMMIKLETISTLSGMGNFPRLSSLLTENELQHLLLKLVQVLSIQLLEGDVTQPTRLVIRSRLIKPSSPAARDEKTRPPAPHHHRPAAPRPRTCPSTLPSESTGLPPPTPPQFQADDDEYGFDQDEMESTLKATVGLDVSEHETQQFHHVLCKQLAALVNTERRRSGRRLPTGGTFQLAKYSFDASHSTWQVSITTIKDPCDQQTEAISMTTEEVTAILNQIQGKQLSATEIAWRYIGQWLMDKKSTQN